MKRTILVAVWGALLIGLWLVLVMDTKPQVNARPASSATDALELDDPGVTEAPKAPPAAPSQPSPAPRAPTPQPLAQTAVQLPPAPANAVRDDLDPPTPSETDGKLAHLYDAWSADKTDSTLTAAVVARMESILREREVNAPERSISCTAAICRTRFTFPDLAAMRSLSRIPQDDKIDVITGDPEPSPTGLSIVIYFAPEGQKLPRAPG